MRKILRLTIAIAPLLASACVFDLAFDASRFESDDAEGGALIVESPVENMVASVPGRAREQFVKGAEAQSPDFFRIGDFAPSETPFLARLSIDEDGDGAAERASYVGFTIREESDVPSASIYNFETVTLRSSTILRGDVLEDTATITGLALVDNGDGLRAPDAFGATGRVIAYKVIDDNVLPFEAEASVDDTGRFTLVGVTPGLVELALVVHDGDREQIAMSVPLPVRTTAGEDVDFGDRPLVALLESPPLGEVEIPGGIENFVIDGVSFVDRFSDGVSSCEQTVPLAQTASVPVGFYDILFCEGGNAVSFLAGVVVGEGPARGLGNLTLGELRQLNDEDDDDLESAASAQGADCLNACAAHGAASGTCLSGDDELDCDDDGDGQSDLSEPPECRLFGAGGDRDGDGICDPDDPFPLCPNATAAECRERTFSPAEPGSLQ